MKTLASVIKETDFVMLTLLSSIEIFEYQNTINVCRMARNSTRTSKFIDCVSSMGFRDKV